MVRGRDGRTYEIIRNSAVPLFRGSRKARTAVIRPLFSSIYRRRWIRLLAKGLNPQECSAGVTAAIRQQLNAESPMQAWAKGAELLNRRVRRRGMQKGNQLRVGKSPWHSGFAGIQVCYENPNVSE